MRTFEVDIVLVRDAEQIVALVRLYGPDQVAFCVFEVDLDSTLGWLRRVCEGDVVVSVPSAGFGAFNTSVLGR